MRYLWVLLLVPSIVSGKGFDFYDTHLDVSGYVAYTYATDSKITNYHDTEDIVVSANWSNTYGYISAQVSNNEYTPIRRLLLDVPLYKTDGSVIDFAIGRLTNPIGLINTNIMRSGVNGTILYPLSTYDPRRYDSMPDIQDGVQLTWSQNFDDIDVRFRTYYGKQVFDNPDIDVYGSHFSLRGDSKDIMGYDVRLTEGAETYHFAYAHNRGLMTSTDPKYVYKFLDHNIDQQLYFAGYSNTFDDINYKIEASYRDLNMQTDVIGVYGKLSYNFTDNWIVHGGISYGTRVQETSTIVDPFIGISDKIHDVTVSLEVHDTMLHNWHFQYNQSLEVDTVYALFSVAYNFR